MGNSIQPITVDVETGSVLDSYEGLFLGSVPVKAPSGAHICSYAVRRINALQLPARVVGIVIATKGVYIVDRDSSNNDLLCSISLEEASFVGIDTRDPTIVSVFRNDFHLRLITCLTFKLASAKEAKIILGCINECFKFRNGEAQPPKDQKKLQRQVSRNLSKKELNRRMSITNKGKVLGVYPTGFVGATSINIRQAGKTPAEKGLKLLLSRKPPIIEAVVYVMEARVEIVDQKNKKLLQELPIEAIAQVKLFDNDKYIVLAAEDPLVKGYQVIVMFNPIKNRPEEVSLRRTIFNAATAAKRQRDSHAKRRRGSSSDGGGGGDVETGTIINVIAAGYLGSLAVDAATGDEVVREAYQRIAVKPGKKRKQIVATKDPVLVQIGTEGIRVFASLTEDLLLRFVLPDISYFSSISSLSPRAFAFIVRDPQLKLLTCHAFELDPRGVQEIQLTVKETFAAALKEKNRMGNDPFKAVGSRVRAPKILFKRQIHRRHLRARKPIGAGQFGQVYLADQVTKERTSMSSEKKVDRAVKTLRGGASESDRDEFVHEAEIMLQLRHKNLVDLIGVAVQQRPWLMVLEFCQYGDLGGVLKACRLKQLKLSNAEQVMLCSQPAAGMQYLAGKGIIHMDIAARNCLVSANNLVKIADFGLAHKLPRDGVFKPATALKLPIKWCSLEVLELRHFSVASDVWAFGILMWEIMSLALMPYQKIPNHHIMRRMRKGVRLDKPDDGFAAVYDLCKQCWAAQPADRPNFSQLFKSLRSVQRKMGFAELKEIRDIAATVTSDHEQKVVIDKAKMAEGTPGYVDFGASKVKNGDELPVFDGTIPNGKGGNAEEIYLRRELFGDDGVEEEEEEPELESSDADEGGTDSSKWVFGDGEEDIDVDELDLDDLPNDGRLETFQEEEEEEEEEPVKAPPKPRVQVSEEEKLRMKQEAEMRMQDAMEGVPEHLRKGMTLQREQIEKIKDDAARPTPAPAPAPLAVVGAGLPVGRGSTSSLIPIDDSANGTVGGDEDGIDQSLFEMPIEDATNKPDEPAAPPQKPTVGGDRSSVLSAGFGFGDENEDAAMNNQKEEA